jgi:hypothetical protein
MTKTMEFHSLNPGEIFGFYWGRKGGPKISWWYTYQITTTYEEHSFKQTFIESILFGKLPRKICVPVRNYSKSQSWIADVDINYPSDPYKGCILDIQNTVRNSRTKKVATTVVFDLFDSIVESCPCNNVVVFGYELKIENDRIIPWTIQLGRENWDVSIQCGFAGY